MESYRVDNPAACYKQSWMSHLDYQPTILPIRSQLIIKVLFSISVTLTSESFTNVCCFGKLRPTSRTVPSRDHHALSCILVV